MHFFAVTFSFCSNLNAAFEYIRKNSEKKVLTICTLFQLTIFAAVCRCNSGFIFKAAFILLK